MPGTGPDLGILTVAGSIPPAARRANGTINGTSSDLKNAGGYALAIVTSDAGTGTSPSLAITVQDSADDSTFAAVSTGAGNIQPTAFTAITTVASVQAQRFDARRARRYVRVSGVTTGAAGGGHIYAALLVYEARPLVG